jgi:hypothetical protein
MATNSFLFKGWAITIAAALSAFAAANTKAGLIAIALVSTVMFWGLDGYYLWLEHCFIKLHEQVAATDADKIDFAMRPNKDHAAWEWFKTCWRPHLWIFYLSIVGVDIVGIFLIKGAGHHGS